MHMAKIKTAENSSKREKILTEASHLFWEKGYKAASMRDLAARVGVEAASLYNHISSKGDLLALICGLVADRFTSFMQEVQKEDIGTIEKAEKIVRFHVRQMVEHYHQVFVTDREWRNLEDPHLTETREGRRSYRRSFAAIIQKGIDDNEIKQVDANTTVMIFLNSINAVDQWHRIIHKVESTELENNMVAILIGGLKK